MLLIKIFLLLIVTLISANDKLNLYRELIKIYINTSIDTALIDVDKIINNENNLVIIGEDIYGREVMMSNKSSYYWSLLYLAAKKDSVNLLIVSGYRSYLYQANIIKRKLASGMTLDSIIMENELPGYSEHHSGCAIDITNNEIKTLSENFQTTNEYKWLLNNAHLYNFYLTYPENNPTKKFEPWHWCYKEKY